MAAYLIATVKVTDDAWVPDYAARLHDIAARHGGEYLSRSGNIRTLEGTAPDATLIALIRFPDADAAAAFAADPAYAPFARARQRRRPGRHRRHRPRRRDPLPAEGIGRDGWGGDRFAPCARRAAAPVRGASARLLPPPSRA